MIAIDGAAGEGGGQILRTSLALSAVTGKPFTIARIRAGRARPGLLRQHLTGVRAVAEVCGATVDGAELGSQRLAFEPGPITAIDHTFKIGSAGSAGLVLQALLPVLLRAPGPSTVTIEGGTHNPASPPAPFLEGTLLPLLRGLGADVALEVVSIGFYPAGGGAYRVRVAPGRLGPLTLVERGPIERIDVRAVIAHLPKKVAYRELDVVKARLGLGARDGAVDVVSSPGPGNALVLAAVTPSIRAVFTTFGEKGVPAERVADDLVDAFVAWRDLAVPVDEHLADQLLVPLALGAGGTFVTGPLSSHTTTNLDVIRRFLDVDVRTTADGEGRVRVDVVPS